MTFRSRSFISAACAAAVAASIAFVSAPSPVHAQIVIPAALDGAEGNGTVSSNTSPLRSLPRTQQVIVREAALNGLTTGDIISGLAFRLDSGVGAARPVNTLTFADYEIYIGQYNDAALPSDTFADNFTPGTRTQVRDNQLIINAGAFPFIAGPGPQPFGPLISFDTPYLYSGGSLLIELRHSGNGVEDIALDAQAPVANAGSKAGSGQTATTATFGDVGVPAIQLQLVSAAAPEPGTLALLLAGVGGAGLGIVRRRRSR